MQQVKTHELCPKLCGLQQTPQSCYEVAVGICLGACNGKESPSKYNKRVKACIESFLEQKETFVIYGSGRTFRETAVVFIEEGVYQGYGYISGEEAIERVDQLKDYIKLKPSNQDTQKIIASYLRTHGEKQVKYFS
jgi:DNA polymerase-3 subunit epsilon